MAVHPHSRVIELVHTNHLAGEQINSRYIGHPTQKFIIITFKKFRSKYPMQTDVVFESLFTVRHRNIYNLERRSSVFKIK